MPLVELRHPEPDWLAYRHEPQRGCPRCTARHPGGRILQLLPHHRYVCTRHRIWIGPPNLLNLDGGAVPRLGSSGAMLGRLADADLPAAYDGMTIDV